MTNSSISIDELIRRAAVAQSVVHQLTGWSNVAELALDLAGSEAVAVTPSLSASCPQLTSALGDRMCSPDPKNPFESIADAAVGVVEGALAVAETGSILLAQDDPCDRAVSMLSRIEIQVVNRDRIVSSLDEVATWIEANEGSLSLATLVTGPSRTADIERSLTIGVQGPSDLHMVILG